MFIPAHYYYYYIIEQKVDDKQITNCTEKIVQHIQAIKKLCKVPKLFH